MPRRRRYRPCVIILASTSMLTASCSANRADDSDDDVAIGPETTIATGIVRHWPEATKHLRFEVGLHGTTAEVGDSRPAGLDAFWSIAGTHPGSGFFYADSIRGTRETRVAHATGAQRVTDIHDAGTLDFTRESVGPVPVGGIVVVEHQPTRRYLAIVVDGIEATDPRAAGAGPYAYADVTWYLTDPDQADFSSAR